PRAAARLLEDRSSLRIGAATSSRPTATSANSDLLKRTDRRDGRMGLCGEECVKLADRRDRALVVACARDHVEGGTTGFDVGVQERGDVFGRSVRRVPLERLERQLVEALHLCGELLAGARPRGTEAAPDVERMLEPAWVPADLCCLPRNLVTHCGVPTRGDPDPEPAVAEPGGAAGGGVRSPSHDERDRR